MKQSDRGTYTCFSFNKHGNQSTDIEMDVQCKYFIFYNILLRLWSMVIYYSFQTWSYLPRTQVIKVHIELDRSH